MPITDILDFYDATMPQVGFVEVCVVRATPTTPAVPSTEFHPCTILGLGVHIRDFTAHRLYKVHLYDELYAALMLRDDATLELQIIQPISRVIP